MSDEPPCIVKKTEKHTLQRNARSLGPLPFPGLGAQKKEKKMKKKGQEIFCSGTSIAR